MPRLPLFPLGLLLFPGTHAPLHIFEERYRALLRDVLASDSRFGIVLPDGDDAPATGAIGVVAQVLTHQPLPDGRSNILVEGAQRFIVRRLLDSGTPYLMGDVEYFGDEEGATELPPDAEHQLRDLAERCRRAMVTLADAPNAASWSADPALLTFQAAGTIPWDATQAHPLLAMRSAAERADLLLRILPGIVPDLERRAEVHRRAGGNGKGPHHGAAVPRE